MNLYLLTRHADDRCGYDEHLGFVICAEDPTAAREFAKMSAADEGKEAWDRADCLRIGVCDAGVLKPGVVLGEFQAG